MYTGLFLMFNVCINPCIHVINEVPASKSVQLVNVYRCIAVHSSVHFTQCTVYNKYIYIGVQLYTLPFSLHTVQCTINILLQGTAVYTLPFSLHSVQLYTLPFSVHTVQCTINICKQVYSCTLFHSAYTLYSVK